MERTSGPQGKGIFLHRQFWLCVFFVSLFAVLLAPLFLASFTPVFAAPLSPAKNTFAASPTQGPVGAVIVVSGNEVFFSDGTRVDLGYTVDDKTCTIVGGGRTGVVQDGSFRGWFRWPAGTGTGSFGVCATANAFTFKVGSYQVLSASVPRISMTRPSLQAGKQATVSGAHFLPGGTRVNLIWRSTLGGQSIVLATAISSGSGAFSRSFIVPARSSTGSYVLSAIVGSGSPPTLSASTTSHVDGITIVAAPTPDAHISPTATAAGRIVATATPRVVTKQSANASDETANKMGLFVSFALGGGFLIVLALGTGVLFIRRQRRRADVNDPTSGPLLWPEATSMISGGISGGPISGPGAFTPWSGTMYPGGYSPFGSPGMEYMPVQRVTAPHAALNKTITIPFDPGLAEAMREAQVSLFVTPRPPVHEEIEVQ